MAKYNVKINNIMRFIRGEEDEFLVEEPPKKTQKKAKPKPKKVVSKKSKAFVKKKDPQKEALKKAELEKRQQDALVREYSKREVIIVRNKNQIVKAKRKYDREKLYYDLKRQAILKEWYRLKCNIKILAEERSRLNKNLEGITSLENEVKKNQKQLAWCKGKIDEFGSDTKKQLLNKVQTTLNVIERSNFNYADDERRFWLEDTRSVGKEDHPLFLKEAEAREKGIFKNGKCKTLNYEDILLTEIENPSKIPAYGITTISKKDFKPYIQFFDKSGYLLTPYKEAFKQGLLLPKDLYEVDTFLLSALVLYNSETGKTQLTKKSLWLTEETLNDISSEELAEYYNYNARIINEINDYQKNATVLRIGGQTIKLVSKNQTLEKEIRIMIIAVIKQIINGRAMYYSNQNQLKISTNLPLKSTPPTPQLILEKETINQKIQEIFDEGNN